MTKLIDSQSHEAKADLYLMDCKNLFSTLKVRVYLKYLASSKTLLQEE